MRDELSYMALAGLGKTKTHVQFDQRGMSHLILDTVCEFYGADKDAVLAMGRKKTLCMCRHISTYFLRRYTNMSLKEIGRFLGGRDHTTAMNSLKQMYGWLETDDDLKNQVRLIQAML